MIESRFVIFTPHNTTLITPMIISIMTIISISITLITASILKSFPRLSEAQTWCLKSSDGVWNRVAEVGVIAETAKYPSMLARSAHLQIFATKTPYFTIANRCNKKRHFTIASVGSPALALTVMR